MDKEAKDRIAETNREQLKSRFEYLRILVFLLATVGSGTLGFALKENLNLKETVVLIIACIILVFISISILRNLNQIKKHLIEIKNLESC